MFITPLVPSVDIAVSRGVQAIITGGYWLKPLTANRLGGDGYFYNRWLAVITGGLKPLSKSGFGPGLDWFWAIFTPVLGQIYIGFGPFFVQILIFSRKKFNTFWAFCLLVQN
jgi:hypothetical protein